MRYRLTALAVACVLALTGCDSNSEPRPRQATFEAEVRLVVLPGPPAYFLQDITDPSPGPGKAYFPLNLPPEHHVEGRRVRVEGYIREELEPIYFMTVFEISRITHIP